MMKILLSLLVMCCVSVSARAEEGATQCVVLLHGLARSPSSMSPVEAKLAAQGYQVVNYGYESTKYSIAELAVDTVEAALAQCVDDEAAHFVTHSMGGILLRGYAFDKGADRIERVVMLGPPNQGSETVDKLGELWLFGFINGPAGKELGTASGSVPNLLGPVEFELGVIAGTASFNPLFSSWLPGEDDGKVSVERAKVDGMSAFRTVPNTHTFMMRADLALDEIVHFLAFGQFACSSAGTGETELCERLP